MTYHIKYNLEKEYTVKPDLTDTSLNRQNDQVPAKR